MTRRGFLGLLGLTGVGGALYTRLLEPEWLELTRLKLRLSKATLVQPFRILHLSDFHASSAVALDYLAGVVETGLKLKPDLILVTGDFITDRFDRFDQYAEILSALPRHAPCFATLGNHDGGSWVASRGGYENTDQVRNLLRRGGLELLHNRAMNIRVKDWNLRLVGLGDWWAKEFEPEAAFAGGETSDNAVVIALSHNPDTKDLLRNYPWDLLLCGHTHGGQFYLPLIGTPFAPVRDKRYVQGLHRWEGRWIHITRGVGSLYGLRFNCRPEVSLLELV